MRLIAELADLKAVSAGGYSYSHSEYVTESTIFYNSLFNGVLGSITFGIVALGIGTSWSPVSVAAFGVVAAISGAYIGYNFNYYSNIEPNTWVDWEVSKY